MIRHSQIGEPLELLPFEERDFDELIAEVPDARFLLQWSGPEWVFPLDRKQLADTLARTTGATPRFEVYKALPAGSGTTVGHVQLIDIDRATHRCVLGRVLIFRRYRGEGLSAGLLRPVLERAFLGLGLEEVSLRVFAFNHPAVATYEKVGFLVSPEVEPHDIDGETWEVLEMKLSRERWSALAGSRTGTGAG